MDVKEYFFNRQCDCCGAILDDELWHNEKSTLNEVASESDWRRLEGRDYCRDCWDWDDEDHIITKDGRKFTEDGERIRTGIAIEELGENTKAQVAAILIIEKTQAWFNGLTDEEKANFAKEFPDFITYETIK